MNDIVLKKDAYFKDIEILISEVYLNKESLKIPNSIKEKGVFGIEGMVLLLIFTWLRSNDNRILKTYVSNYSGFDDICNSMYGICALRMSDLVLDSSGMEVDKEVCLDSGYKRVRNVIKGNYKEAFKGLYVGVPSIKSRGVNREFNSPLYFEKDVIDKESFIDVFSSIVEAVVPQQRRLFYIEEMLDGISSIVWELFDNTHKHGRYNEKGDLLETNFRGVVFNCQDLTKSKLLELTKSGVSGLVGFASDWINWIEQNDRNIPVLDITVVDSGPGYARRWTSLSKENIEFDKEVEAIMECFTKNRTTSKNKADGHGLTHVLNDLKKTKGWFRLRTGSTSVSKSFFMGGEPQINSSDIYNAGSFVEGNSFNVVIPLIDFVGGGRDVSL